MGKYSRADIIEGKERTLKNGMLAGHIMIDGREQFRIIGMVDQAAHQRSVTASRPGRAGKELSPKGAMRAFNRYYKNKAYKTETARKSARSRDLCWNNQEKVEDRRYSRSPHRFDYPGVDDGSRCDSPHQWKNGYNPVKMEKGSPEALEWGKKMKQKKTKKQAGGAGVEGGARPVSLKTAVRLLRQYYDEKYN